MTPTLGRIIHVRPFIGNTTSEDVWWAAIVVEVVEDEKHPSFSARAYSPKGAHDDTTRLLIAADENKTWRRPPPVASDFPGSGRPVFR